MAPRYSRQRHALIGAQMLYTELDCCLGRLEGISHPIDGCLEDKKCAQKEVCTYMPVHCWLHHVQISRVR